LKAKLLIGLVCSALVLSACSYEAWQDMLAPEEESAFARDYLDALLAFDIEYIDAHSHRALRDKLTDELYAELKGYVPQGERLSTEPIGFETKVASSGWSGNFSFEYEYTDGWVIANAAVVRIDDELQVTGFNVYRTEESQRVINALFNVDLTPLRIVGLLLTILVPLFMIFTCYSVYKTPIPAKKKRWYFFSFVGIFGFGLNWTTGIWQTQIATVKIVGFAMAAAGPHAPWILEFTVPIGAIAFWVMRKELLAQPAEPRGDIDSADD
jgi:hypothetical protein